MKNEYLFRDATIAEKMFQILVIIITAMFLAGSPILLETYNQVAIKIAIFVLYIPIGLLFVTSVFSWGRIYLK